MKIDLTNDLLKSKKFMLMGTTALLVALAGPGAYAQTDDDIDGEEDEVVAVGIRQSIEEARDLKRNADTAVDSIVASDVSTLPDLSVAEALQRVPGVVAQRFDIQNNNGGDFPSPEGGGNLIRGLTLVRSEFNGRDSFSANAGRALDFGTVPPELIGAVDVYKNTTADLVEGGIGGSINLRTLEPFDRSGPVAVVTLDGTYTDLREEWAPDFSVVLGNRWDAANGEFGLLGSFSSSELKSDLHGFQIGQIVPVNTGSEIIGVPGGFQARTNDVDRKRDAYYLAGQWQSNDGDLRVTAKYALIENTVDSDERTLEFFPDGESFGATQLASVPGQSFSSSPFNTSIPSCNGSNDPDLANASCERRVPITALFEEGYISNGLRDWTGIDFVGPVPGAPFTNLGIHQEDESKTDDISLNVKWQATDRLFVNLDAHKTTASFDRTRLWAGSRFFSDFYFVPNIDNPRVQLIPDPNGEVWSVFRANGTVNANPTDLSDPDNAYLLFAADEFFDNEGELTAVSGDAEYEFMNDGWFESVKFGARFVNREQTNRQAGLNWAAVSPPWAGGYAPYSGLDDPSNFEAVSFADFFRGGVFQGPNTDVIFPDRGLLSDYDAFAAFIANDSLINSTGTDWNPLRVNGEVDYVNRGAIGQIEEDTINLYARFDFSNEATGFSNGWYLDGNVGLRYTKTDVDGEGVLRYIAISGQPDDLAFTPESLAFSQQAPVDQSFSSSDEHWLPSLNFKLHTSDNGFFRFGLSKNITRPTIGDLTPSRTATVTRQFIIDETITDPTVSRIANVLPTTVSIGGGNTELKAIEAINLDLSYEHYWGDANSFTFSFFAKDIENNIIDGNQTIGTETLDGETVPVVFVGKLNQDKAEIRGFEVAYSKFFDQLPSIFGNMGIQANYTYIDATTNPPSPVQDADGDGLNDIPSNFQRIYRYGATEFLGLSEHAANLIGIYEDDTKEFRVAYNWRSEYLGSYRDFVTGNPIYQQPTGYLDASAKYNINDNFQVRLQVANILDTRATAEQQIDDAGNRYGRTSFVGDRRVKIGLRYQY